jgi:selenocysteine lyase/cysteine desulfurase
MQQHKQQLLLQLWQGLAQMPHIELLSKPDNNAGIVAFNVRGEHPSDVAALLDQQQIAVRAGTHCAMPLFQAIGRSGAVRLSLAAYNQQPEIERTLQAVAQAVALLK